MTMIQEAYCSYEIAKLLKEKGFDAFCDTGWDKNLYDKEHARGFSIGFDKKENWISRPTHQMAMAWLREKGIDVNIFLSYISIEFGKKEKHYSFEIISDNTDYDEYSYYATYEDAVEAALKYALENLI